MKQMRTMYENASSMSGRYCDEAEKMTRNIEQLNTVYENMLRAIVDLRETPQHVARYIERQHRRQNDVHEVDHPLPRRHNVGARNDAVYRRLEAVAADNPRKGERWYSAATDVRVASPDTLRFSASICTT